MNLNLEVIHDADIDPKLKVELDRLSFSVNVSNADGQAKIEVSYTACQELASFVKLLLNGKKPCSKLSLRLVEETGSLTTLGAYHVVGTEWSIRTNMKITPVSRRVDEAADSMYEQVSDFEQWTMRQSSEIRDLLIRLHSTKIRSESENVITVVYKVTEDRKKTLENGIGHA